MFEASPVLFQHDFIACYIPFGKWTILVSIARILTVSSMYSNMPTYFRFDNECKDSIADICKNNLKLKWTVHRTISFSITRNKFLLLLIYQRVTVDPRY